MKKEKIHLQGTVLGVEDMLSFHAHNNNHEADILLLMLELGN